MSGDVRIPLAQARALAEEVADLLRPHALRLEIAGSIRRGKPDIGDIEIVAQVGQMENARLDVALAQLVERQVIQPELRADGKRRAWGSRLCAGWYKNMRLDLFIVRPDRDWGVTMLTRTGPGDANKYLVARGLGCPRDLCFDEGSVWRLPSPDAADDPKRIGWERLTLPEEADVFAALGLPYVEPGDRSEATYKRLRAGAGTQMQLAGFEHSNYALEDRITGQRENRAAQTQAAVDAFDAYQRGERHHVPALPRKYPNDGVLIVHAADGSVTVTTTILGVATTHHHSFGEIAALTAPPPKPAPAPVKPTLVVTCARVAAPRIAEPVRALVLSLWQPWALLLATGAKEYETRSWKPDKDTLDKLLRGGWWVVIHAAKRWTAAEKAFTSEPYFARRIAEAGYTPNNLPLGAAIGAARLVGVHRTEVARSRITAEESTYGDFTTGRWAWQMADARLFSAPIPLRGQQGLWAWDDSVRPLSKLLQVEA